MNPKETLSTRNYTIHDKDDRDVRNKHFVILLHNFKGIYAVLSRIWKCRKSRVFGANFLGKKIGWCYIFRFLQLWSPMLFICATYKSILYNDTLCIPNQTMQYNTKQYLQELHFSNAEYLYHVFELLILQVINHEHPAVWPFLQIEI